MFFGKKKDRDCIDLLKSGKFREAIECFDSILRINPNFAPVWVLKGIANDAVAWYNEGIVLGNLGRYEEALECFDRALKIDPNDALAWNNKGVALRKLGRYEEALECYDRALKIDPNDAEAWYNKGVALGNLGRHEEALKCFNKALEIDPNFELAKKAKEETEELLKKMIPRLDVKPSTKKPEIKLSQTNFNLDEWHRVRMELKNNNPTPIYNLTLSFPEDVEVRGLKTVNLDPMESKVIDFGLKPKSKGNIPLEITAHFEDGSRSYEERFIVWIEVSSPSKPILPASVESLKERFEFLEFIGSGGFADVYKVRNKDGEISALKIPKAVTKKIRKIFIRELAAWLNLKHPNILKIKDYDTEPYPYIELEYAEMSLEDLDLPLEPEKACSIAFQILDALRYAHSKEIYHRDIKPSNVLFVNGVPKLSDWGLAKLASSSKGVLEFTPLYSAPEFFQQKAYPKSDVFQVGLILYEMLTGLNPFEAETKTEIEQKIRFYNPPKPSEINPKAKPLDDVVMSALEKDVDRRIGVDEAMKKLADYLGFTYSKALSRNEGLRAAYYCGELLMVHLRMRKLAQAYKYASDLVNYAEGNLRNYVIKLCDHIKSCLSSRYIPDEEFETLVEYADFIIHKIRVGFEV